MLVCVCIDSIEPIEHISRFCLWETSRWHSSGLPFCIRYPLNIHFTEWDWHRCLFHWAAVPTSVVTQLLHDYLANHAGVRKFCNMSVSLFAWLHCTVSTNQGLMPVTWGDSVQCQNVPITMKCVILFILLLLEELKLSLWITKITCFNIFFLKIFLFCHLTSVYYSVLVLLKILNFWY